MKNPGQIFTAICITIIISIRLIRMFEPFEWQRQPTWDFQNMTPEELAENIEKQTNPHFPFDHRPHSPFDDEFFTQPFDVQK